MSMITGNSANEQTRQKWLAYKGKLLEGLDSEKTKWMGQILENQYGHVAEYIKKGGQLNEAASGVPGNPSVSTGSLAILPKLTIPMLRRVLPNTIGTEFVGVQPMNGPTGMIFSLRYTYQGQAGQSNVNHGSNIFTGNTTTNPMFDTGPSGPAGWGNPVTGTEAAYSGTWTDQNYEYGDEVFGTSYKQKATAPDTYTNTYNRLARRFYSGAMTTNASGGYDNTSTPAGYGASNYGVGGQGFNTAGGQGQFTDSWYGQSINYGNDSGQFGSLEGYVGNQLGLKILRQTINATTRKLSARWTPEAQQDLQYMNGLDMQTELATILESEIMQDIDNEIFNDLLGLPDASNIRVVDLSVAPLNTTPNSIVDIYSNLGPVIQYVANNIAKRTRRAAANRMLLSPTMVSVLSSGAKSVFAPTLQGTFDTPSNNKFVGTLNGSIKCYSYLWFDSDSQIGGNGQPVGYDPILLGYKGDTNTDAGYFYAPYVPLYANPAVIDPQTFESVISFTTRYGKAAFIDPSMSLANSPDYYGKIVIKALSNFV